MGGHAGRRGGKGGRSRDVHVCCTCSPMPILAACFLCWTAMGLRAMLVLFEPAFSSGMMFFAWQATD